VLMAGMDLPVRAIREQVGSAVHLICQISRFSDGTRKVSKITEVSGLEGDRITLQDIFEFVQTGVGEDGKVNGTLQPTGSVPTFIEDIATRGITMDRSIFDTSRQENRGWRR
jgi:pilus assembly protein CpaF